MSEYKECEDEKMDNDESGRRENGWESKVTPLPRQSLLCASEWTFRRLHKEINTPTHTHTHTEEGGNSLAAMREEHSEAVSSRGHQVKEAN